MNEEVTGEGIDAQPTTPRADKRKPRTLWVVLGVALVAILAVGAYLVFGGGGRVKSVSDFRSALDSRGWESQDSNPANFISRSSYELKDNGFVALLEYRDEAAATVGQDKRSSGSKNSPGFKVAEDGSVRSWSFIYPSDPELVPKELFGIGALDVQFGKYRFESTGKRSDIDALVDGLGFLDPKKKVSDPIAAFRSAVKESRITTTTDSGYSERSSSKLDGLTAECMQFHTLDDARGSYDTFIRRLKEGKTKYTASHKGATRTVSFVLEWPDDSGKKIEQYAQRVYNGELMIAASGPVERKSDIVALLKELGY